jgi:hypothetical protein
MYVNTVLRDHFLEFGSEGLSGRDSGAFEPHSAKAEIQLWIIGALNICK